MSCRITGKICDAWSDVAGCGMVRCKFVEANDGDKMVTDSRKSCPMRHENGNCTVAGGFCTAVNDPICEALHNAFDCGHLSALRQQETVTNRNGLNEPLTMDELREMDGEPVWVEFQDGSGGCWGLVHITVFTHIVFANGLFCTVGKPYFGKTWLAYRSKPEEWME